MDARFRDFPVGCMQRSDPARYFGSRRRGTATAPWLLNRCVYPMGRAQAQAHYRAVYAGLHCLAGRSALHGGLALIFGIAAQQAQAGLVLR